MKYELYVKAGTMEFTLPCKNLQEAKFLARMVREIKENPNSAECAINDLEKGETL